MGRCQQQVDCNVYTDGSKLEGQVGAGIFISRQNHQPVREMRRLPDQATVYQAEMAAICEAAKVLQQSTDLTSVKFFVDSQAALRTFQKVVKSKIALQTIHELNKIDHQSMIFVWTKAHIGTTGNEEADVLAKEGSRLPDEDILNIPSPSCEIKNSIDRRIRILWQRE